MIILLAMVFQQELFEPGVQARLQLEARSPMSYSAGAEGDEFGTTRIRPHLWIRPAEAVTLFIQPQASFGFWGDTPTPPDVDEVDLHQLYVGWEEIPKVRNGLGLAILSTPRGVLSDQQARDAHVGGEVLAQVW